MAMKLMDGTVVWLALDSYNYQQASHSRRPADSWVPDCLRKTGGILFRLRLIRVLAFTGAVLAFA